jgi:hypothetical protein
MVEIERDFLVFDAGYSCNEKMWLDGEKMKFRCLSFILFERIELINRDDGYDCLITIVWLLFWWFDYDKSLLDQRRYELCCERTSSWLLRLYYYFKSLTGWAKVAGLCYPGELNILKIQVAWVGKFSDALPARIRRAWFQRVRPLSSRAHKSSYQYKSIITDDGMGVGVCPTVNQESQTSD